MNQRESKCILNATCASESVCSKHTNLHELEMLDLICSFSASVWQQKALRSTLKCISVLRYSEGSLVFVLLEITESCEDHFTQVNTGGILWDYVVFSGFALQCYGLNVVLCLIS